MLHGEKVILRAVEREDIKRLHELEQNVELMLLGDGDWQPVPLASFEKNFEKDLENKEYSYFAIEADGKLIGTTGLHHKSRRDGSTDFGIGIYDPDYLGKGYGRDAINVLVDWTFRIQNFRRIGLQTIANNERAIRAYAACGFVIEGRLRELYYYEGAYVDSICMSLLRSEWEARQKLSVDAK